MVRQLYLDELIISFYILELNCESSNQAHEYVVALEVLGVAQVTKYLIILLRPLNMDVSRFLILLNAFPLLACHDIIHFVFAEVTLHEYVHPPIRHQKHPFVSLSGHWAYGNFLVDILESHAVDDAESELDTEFKPFKLVAIFDSLTEDRGCVKKQF